jgi:hypothetical protein
MLTQWLQPIPEKKYIRVVYVGKIRLVGRDGRKSKDKLSLEAIIDDIWKRASVFNRENFISGHLSCAKTLHVVQLLEGKEKIVLNLMKRIRKDPRVIIHKEFIKMQLSMHLGWAISMCYSFDITSAQLSLVQDTDLTMEDMFEMMKNTYQVRQECLDLPSFYKEIIETILLKFISISDGGKGEKELVGGRRS